jgi:putative acetyltransferase
MDIRVDDLSGPEIRDLLQEHLRNAALHSPPESVHALDLERLRKPDITFWSVWHASQLLGCGALKELDARHGEIKSMRTATAHLRKGVAASLMRHMLEESRRRSYRRLSLETGSMAAFAPAAACTRFGFSRAGRSELRGSYSVFMTREQEGRATAAGQRVAAGVTPGSCAFSYNRSFFSTPSPRPQWRSTWNPFGIQASLKSASSDCATPLQAQRVTTP